MIIARWLDRLEIWCGPVLPWGVAVAIVAVALPPTLLWHTLHERWQARAAWPDP
jgi:hypothetical protein